MTGPVWKARADNPHYRINELILPGQTSTGLHRLPFKTILLPHASGKLLVKSSCLKRNVEINSNKSLEFKSGCEVEVRNIADQEQRLTIIQFKSSI